MTFTELFGTLGWYAAAILFIAVLVIGCVLLALGAYEDLTKRRGYSNEDIMHELARMRRQYSGKTEGH